MFSLILQSATFLFIALVCPINTATIAIPFAISNQSSLVCLSQDNSLISSKSSFFTPIFLLQQPYFPLKLEKSVAAKIPQINTSKVQKIVKAFNKSYLLKATTVIKKDHAT